MYSFGSFTNLVRTPLRPELQSFLVGNDLHHPLVHFDYVDPRWYSRLNQLYEHRLGECASPRQEQNDWEKLRSDLTPNARLNWLCEHVIEEPFSEEYRDRMDDYYRIVGQIWTDTELPFHNSDLISVLFGYPFPAHPIEAFMVKNERQRLAELPEELQVFRGHVPVLEHKQCWTLSPTVALNWACKSEPDYRGPEVQVDPIMRQFCAPIVTVGTVLKSQILAYVNRRDEDEILVNPDYVRDRQSYDVFRDDYGPDASFGKTL